MAEINEVKLNGQTILSTRSNTVTEDTLVQGETAQNKAGESIVGRLDPVDKDKAYLISDEIGEIDNADYMPFYDTSEQKKKKTLFGSIVEKLKSVFAQKTDLKAHTFEVGTEIPENADLNNYTTAGVYKIAPDATASTISNIPIAHGGKLIVMEGVSNAETYKMQLFIEHEDNYYTRRTTGNAWSNWKQLASTDDIAPSTVGNGYAVGTVSGSAITATISGFKLRAGVIVAIRLGSGLPANCTLNISNTGVKDIYYWGDNAIREMDVFNGSSIYTFMYDGTRYRLLSWSLVPTIFDQNYVADTSGNIGLTVGYNVNAFQIKNSIDSKKLVWNYYKNSAWRGDVKIADFDDLVHQSLGISIPDNANLNDYTTNGIYNVSSNTKAVTITNIPVTRAGKLIVMRVAGNTYINQFYITYNNSSSDNDGIFRRSYTGSAWLAWRRLTSDNDVGASIAKTGKSILPIWSYNTNTITSNGVTATFNPLTGEITLNGTATAKTYFPLYSGKNLPSYEKLPKGTYVLSGCPSGGSSTTYELDFYCSKGSWFEHGSGVTFTLSSDANLNDDWFIFVASGQTVSNLVFKPMLRPAFTTADYEPCEDIHKGNCYVGTCTTAGATKDKVAYVDGYFVLRKGVRVAIKFSNTNTYSSTTASPITLNVNDTGAKNIWYNSTHSGAGNTGAYTTIYGVANLYYYFVYDGTYWVWDGRDVDNNTTYTNMTLGNGYGTCATAESTTAKVVTLANYNLLLGGYVSVKFTYAVPANATMNINSKGAKNIWYRGANITANVIKAGDLATFIYDGTRYHLVGIDRDSTAQKYYVVRDDVTWSAKLGSNYNTTNWSCNIHRSGNILIGSMEIATSQGANTIVFPAYSNSSTDVFCRFPFHALAGYFECIVTIGTVTYPAFISTGTINGTQYTEILLRNNLTITKNENIKVTFVAFLEND